MKNSILIIFSGLLLACNAGKAEVKPDAAVVVAPAPTPTPTPTVEVKPVQHIELQIASVGNTMDFDKKTLEVPTGAEVHLVFKNNTNMQGFLHNWALVKPGTEAKVAANGLKAGVDGNYVDPYDQDMMFFTPLAQPGKTTEVTFTAPAPGKYPYICTFPGHYMMMKGVLTVTQ